MTLKPGLPTYHPLDHDAGNVAQRVTRTHFLAILERVEHLPDNPKLRQSRHLRAPYLDPLNHPRWNGSSATLPAIPTNASPAPPSSPSTAPHGA